jgi:hypothetical protein
METTSGSQLQMPVFFVFLYVKNQDFGEILAVLSIIL